MKRKIGDKVRVRGDLVEREVYNGLTIYPKMMNYLGYEGEIDRIGNKGYYSFKNIDFWWSDDMLEDSDEPLVYDPDANKTIIQQVKAFNDPIENNELLCNEFLAGLDANKVVDVRMNNLGYTVRYLITKQ